MKKLVYAGTELLTGDDIAMAVLRYCQALAEARTAELIEIPVLTADGSRTRATFIVGPSSQMIAVDEDGSGEGEEIVDLDVIARLEERIRAQHPTAHSNQHDATNHSSRLPEWRDDY
jgi:hypothetical protein